MPGVVEDERKGKEEGEKERHLEIGEKSLGRAREYEGAPLGQAPYYGSHEQVEEPFRENVAGDEEDNYRNQGVYDSFSEFFCVLKKIHAAFFFHYGRLG